MKIHGLQNGDEKSWLPSCCFYCPAFQAHVNTDSRNLADKVTRPGGYRRNARWGGEALQPVLEGSASLRNITATGSPIRQKEGSVLLQHCCCLLLQRPRSPFSLAQDGLPPSLANGSSALPEHCKAAVCVVCEK